MSYVALGTDLSRFNMRCFSSSVEEQFRPLSNPTILWWRNLRRAEVVCCGSSREAYKAAPFLVTNLNSAESAAKCRAWCQEIAAALGRMDVREPRTLVHITCSLAEVWDDTRRCIPHATSTPVAFSLFFSHIPLSRPCVCILHYSAFPLCLSRCARLRAVLWRPRRSRRACM